MSYLIQNDFVNLARRVERYREVLENTRKYREIWNTQLRDEIVAQLTRICKEGGLSASVEVRSDIENLSAIVLSLGDGSSGLGETVAPSIRRELVKHNGSLVYQQLFNGKILVMINLPFIEKYGQQQQPKQVAIYRPEELKEPYFVRHLETFVDEITKWEDYDDDRPDDNQRIGFKLNFEQGAAPTA